jgi:DNA-binding response OmpR family regulator
LEIRTPTAGTQVEPGAPHDPKIAIRADLTGHRGLIVAKYRSALRVLIVDDEPLMRWAIGETLRSAGHIPILAANGHEAIRAASAPPSVDIIVLDYQLPDRDGFDLLVALRCLAIDAGVIVITAYDSEDLRSGAYRFGANRVLPKPLEMETLPAIVNEVNHCRPI